MKDFLIYIFSVYANQSSFIQQFSNSQLKNVLFIDTIPRFSLPHFFCLISKAKGTRRQRQNPQLLEFLLQISLYLQMLVSQVQMHVGSQCLEKFKYKLQACRTFGILLRAQEVLVQELPAGTFQGIRKYTRGVPLYYLCGAGAWKKTEIVNPPQKCNSVCSTKRLWSKTSCIYWAQKCDPVPPVLGRIRINGISFNYCHFQNWHTKIGQEEKGSWDWQGMQMCPDNMQVYGFKSKLTQRDGMAGMILLCRSMRNSREITQILVFDGEGSWRGPVSSVNFAVGFNAKIREGYINGLSIQMSTVSYIFGPTFKYIFPLNFNETLLQIESQTQQKTTDQPYWPKRYNQTTENSCQEFERIIEARSTESILPAWMFSEQLLSTKIRMPLTNSMFDFQHQEIEGKRKEKKVGIAETIKVGIINKQQIFHPA